MRDLHNNIDVRRALSPKAAVTDNTAYVSEVLDRRGFESVELLLAIGANTDSNATFTVLLEEGSDGSTFTAVADADLLGTEALASFTAADDDNKVKKLGYTGSKRYLRATVTPAANDSGNHFVAAVWLLGHPNNAPTVNPPA
jgi:hypothetical protein